MFELGTKSWQRLAGVHPKLVKVVVRGLELSAVDFAVTEGLRTKERQAELLKKGFSRTMASKHRRQADGFAHAVDVMAVGDLDGDGDKDAQDKSLTWDPKVYGQIAAAMKQASAELGIPIRWGGDFKSWFDGPHFELRL